MSSWKGFLAILITISVVSAFWLNFNANLRQKTKDLNEEISALQQERYEQRREIAKYHIQETTLLREVTRLKSLVEKKSAAPAREKFIREEKS